MPSEPESRSPLRISAKRAKNDPCYFAEALLGFKPAPYQARLLRDPAKRVVVKWPRQSGKSTTLAAKAVWFAATHRDATILLVSPSLRQSINLRDTVAGLVGRIPAGLGVVSKSLRTTIYFRSGSRIVALPANPDTLRGFAAHLIIVDEADFFQDPESIFYGTLHPMLTATGGTLIVSSTPWTTKGFYYRLCQEDSGYSRHFITWQDAVRAGIAREEVVREAERNNPPEIFRREYNCEFVADANAFLPSDLIAQCIDADSDYYPFEAQASGEFHVGVDLGKHQDYSVVAAVEREGETLRLVHLKRFPLGTPYASVIGYVKALRDRWNYVASVWVDQTGVGDPIVEEMRRAGIPGVVGVRFTREAKESLAVPAKQAMLAGRVRIPYDRDLIAELNVERYEMTKDGHVAFSHPERAHDDRFWAFALAVSAALRGEGGRARPLARSF